LKKRYGYWWKNTDFQRLTGRLKSHTLSIFLVWWALTILHNLCHIIHIAIEGHAVAGKEASCLEDFQIVPHFPFMSAERERDCIALFLPSVDWWVQIDGLDFKLSTWCYIIPIMIFWNVWKLIPRTEDQSIGSIATKDISENFG
jgi:hypothetical protein